MSCDTKRFSNFWLKLSSTLDFFKEIIEKIQKILQKMNILSVSESASVPELWDLSVGRTDTVSVLVYTSIYSLTM